MKVISVLLYSVPFALLFSQFTFGYLGRFPAEAALLFLPIFLLALFRVQIPAILLSGLALIVASLLQILAFSMSGILPSPGSFGIFAYCFIFYCLTINLPLKAQCLSSKTVQIFAIMLLISLASIALICFLQNAGFGAISEILWNPFGPFSPLNEYEASRLIGLSSRARGTFLEPSFAALFMCVILSSLFILNKCVNLGLFLSCIMQYAVQSRIGGFILAFFIAIRLFHLINKKSIPFAGKSFNSRFLLSVSILSLLMVSVFALLPPELSSIIAYSPFLSIANQLSGSSFELANVIDSSAFVYESVSIRTLEPIHHLVNSFSLFGSSITREALIMPFSQQLIVTNFFSLILFFGIFGVALNVFIIAKYFRALRLFLLGRGDVAILSLWFFVLIALFAGPSFYQVYLPFSFMVVVIAFKIHINSMPSVLLRK